jgi:hypothetical protein
LLTDPAFLGKNQIPDKGAEPIYIPALPLTRRFVCKRNSLAYPGRNGFNREIRDTLLNRDKKSFIGTRTQSKAHDVRALASSWALFNNASLNEVLSAGFWRGERSFLSHYLRFMSIQADNLFSRFALEFVKYSLTRRFVCKRNSLAYPGRNGFNREIRDALLNRDNKSFIGTRTL